jgi:hypothetical protein
MILLFFIVEGPLQALHDFLQLIMQSFDVSVAYLSNLSTVPPKKGNNFGNNIFPPNYLSKIPTPSGDQAPHNSNANYVTWALEV